MCRLALTSALVLALAGCSSTLLETRVNVPELSLTDEDEAALGLQIDRELRRGGLATVRDEKVLGYANGLFKRVTGIDTREAGAPWHLHLIADASKVDTFSTPGGHVYVYSGLLRYAADEAEVVAAIGHEVGHAAAKHVLRHMVQTYGAPTMTRLAANDPAALAEISQSFVQKRGGSGYTIEEENSADAYAMKLSAAASYDPRAIESFFERMASRQSDGAWVQRHPVVGSRNANVNLILAREHLYGDGRFPERLQVIKRHMEADMPVSSVSPYELGRFFGSVSQSEADLPDIDRELH